MKVSIITVTYNSEVTIEDTLRSVALQTYSNIEHIIIDGSSKDKTIEIVKKFNHVVKIISEPDKGIYDAMNKGINIATGEIVGILNSDDFYQSDNIISKIVQVIEEKNVDSVYGDVKFVKSENLNKIVRYYSSANWNSEKFAFGYMPAHPSFFVKRKAYQNCGLFKTDYKISADYELMVRFLYVNKLSSQYINEPLVVMRAGGVSNQGLKSIYILNKEIIRACRENGISTNFFKISLKFFSKLREFINPSKIKTT